MSNGNKRLIRQIEFIKETDRLKDVLRQTYTAGGKRRENDAEHSWHLALMAILLHEHANTSLSEGDLLRVIKMLIIHDIVEIDAGDTFAYDDDGLRDKEEREEKRHNVCFPCSRLTNAKKFTDCGGNSKSGKHLPHDLPLHWIGSSPCF